MKRSRCRLLPAPSATDLVLVAAMLLSSSHELWGQALPPPTASRAPLLTQLPVDSIRRQVVFLKLTQLLQDLQQSAGTAVDADAAEIEWSGADQAARADGQCATRRGLWLRGIDWV